MLKKGFTLIELLAVIVIIAIISTIGIYSVTKLINKSRLNSLTDTAFGVKKAARLYVAANPDMIFPKNLNMTPANGGDPAGAYAHLLDLGKDPWGKDYESVIANINKIDNKLIITVYIMTEYKDYYLGNTSKLLNELILEPQLINSTIQADPNANFKLEYTLHNIYPITSHSLKFIGETPSHTIISDSVALNSNDRYEISLKISQAGSYQAQIEIINTNGIVQSNIITLNIYTTTLPSTLYFRNDNTLGTIDSSSSRISGGYMPWNIPYYYSIRISRKNGTTETIISNWQQAKTTWSPIPCDPFWVKGKKTATYNFPGWDGGNFNDQLVIEVGISSSNEGAPVIYAAKFVSSALNTKELKPHIFTVYYNAAWMDEDTGDCYYVFEYGTSKIINNETSRIETVPVILNN